MMSVVPPIPDSADRPIQCQHALSDRLKALADEALAAGWRDEEVATALMELTNAWYFEARASDEASRLIRVVKV